MRRLLITFPPFLSPRPAVRCHARANTVSYADIWAHAELKRRLYNIICWYRVYDELLMHLHTFRRLAYALQFLSKITWALHSAFDLSPRRRRRRHFWRLDRECLERCLLFAVRQNAGYASPCYYFIYFWWLMILMPSDDVCYLLRVYRAANALLTGHFSSTAKWQKQRHLLAHSRHACFSLKASHFDKYHKRCLDAAKATSNILMSGRCCFMRLGEIHVKAF